MAEGFQALTEHEKETLRLLLRGYDIKSIAADLGLSVHTVNERLRDARRKLGTSSSRQAARILGDIERGGANFPGDKCYGVGDGTARGANQEHSHRTPGKGHPIAWLGGGMLIMSLIIAAAALAFVLHQREKAVSPIPRTSAAVSPISSPSQGMALGWLPVLDAQGWDASWIGTGELLRSQVLQAQWASHMQALRQPLGPVTSRVFQGVTKATTLPGLPDGQYEIVQFVTRFEKKPTAIETVVVAQEASGWRIEGYSIK